MARERADSHAFLVPPGPDEAIAAVAAGQFGVVTLRQIEACGLDRGAIRHRIATGRLQRVWRGVYAFGHRELRREGYLLAAVLTYGTGAKLSHRAAASRWELIESGVIEVTVAGKGSRAKRPGVRLHRTRCFDPADVTERDGIPITTVARTLVDLNAVVPDRLLERALEQAYVRRLLVPGALEDALGRAGGRKTRTLSRLLAAERHVSTITRSELEERFLTLVRRGGLPDPEVNARVHGYEVDFLWRARRRVIEVDGHAYHSTRQAATRDRRKDDDLAAAGYAVTRFTADQILHDPADTLARTQRAVGSTQ